MCHRTAPKCVDRVIRDSTNSFDEVAQVAQTLGPKRRGQGWGRFTSTEVCFLLGTIEDTRTEAGASLITLPLVVIVSSKEPSWEEAQAVALGSGLCPSASRLQGGLAEGQPVPEVPPPPGWWACTRVSYKAVASRFRGRGASASTRRGRARCSWVFQSLLVATHACHKGSVG